MDGKISGEMIRCPDAALVVAMVAADFLAALATLVLEVSANTMAKVIEAMDVILLLFDEVRLSTVLLLSVTPFIDNEMDLFLIEFSGTCSNAEVPVMLLGNG